MKRFILLIIWLGFILYSVFLAPEGNGPYLSELLTMNHPDPSLLAMFSLLGVFPAVFAILLLRDDSGSVPAWPFVVGSFLLGAFSLLPYFILNKNKERSNRTPNKVRRFLQLRGLSIVLIGLAFGLMVYGLLAGDATIYQKAFLESNFVHVMTIDFLVLTGLSIVALRDRDGVAGWIGLLPIIGPLSLVITKNGKERKHA
ncbi:hypothetical protein [Guptibacillus hwajinpoensis]|uniref:hypothetical protein n=1 Tax=Guptibacillus hwajinpoensis TaxID=208199 RepID=UPI001CFE2539|nr:hypothetical protein [Pseudalkalibacillus hwajinpoensis]WLR57905.1 hypothetical protein LC071_11355 [Pseudalkalibacillus hwajinpoensis]